MLKPICVNRESKPALLAMCLLMLARPAFSGSVTITSIGLPIGGDSGVVGINAAGQAAGDTLNGTGLSSVGNCSFIRAARQRILACSAAGMPG
jgi:hypothetical protein